MRENHFQIAELEAYIGSENLCDFDLTAIISEATFVDMDDPDKNRYWKEGIDLAEICARHDLAASQYVSATEAAKMLGVSRMRVNQLVNSGKLEAVKVGNAWNIRRSSIDRRLSNR